MTDTFAFQPDQNPTGTVTYRTLKAQFGDGYAQEVGDGLNTELNSWVLTFSGGPNDVFPVRDFIRAHGGAAIPFLYQPPTELAPMLFKCTNAQWTVKNVYWMQYQVTLDPAYLP